MNHQPSKTVSLYLTRVPNTSNSYVHVLRCNICDYLTLNTANFKEHFRIKHPSSLGFWTYSCCQCSSMSTEKSLMEEHLKLYHRMNDGPTGKLLERFHEPNASDLPVGIAQAATIPLTLTSGASSLTTSGLTFNLLSAIQNAGRNQSSPTSLPFANKACTINGPVTYISSPTVSSPLLPSPPEVTAPLVEGTPEVKADDLVSVSISNESAAVATGTVGYCVSGSRRRKATTPGRICPTASTNTVPGDQSDLEEDVKTTGDEPKCGELGAMVATEEASVSNKRVVSACDVSSVSETQDNTAGVSLPPSPKRFCALDISKAEHTVAGNETALSSKGQLTTSNLPFIISIANAGDSSSGGNSAKSLNSNVAVCSQPLGTSQNGGSMMGQLIPISGLPDHLFCGISTSLVGGSAGNNTPLLPHSLINTPVTFSLPVLENQHSLGTSGSASAWLLTNQGTMNAAPGSIATLQPTLLVPIPATISESLPLSNAKPMSAPSVEINASGGLIGGNSNVVRLSDLLDALRSVAVGGSLVTSVNVPFNNPLLTNAAPSGLSDASVLPQSFLSTTGHSQIPADNLSAVEPTTVTGISRCSAGPANLDAFLCSLPSASMVTAPVVSATTSTSSTANTTSVNALLNQLIMAAVAAVNSSSASFDVARGISNPGHPTAASIVNEQALDMSVRSAITPGSQADTLFTESDACRTSEEGQTTSNGKKAESTDAISVITALPKPDSSGINSLHGVVEILSAALKGGLKQRLIQSGESMPPTITSSLAQCLAASSTTMTQSNADRLNDSNFGILPTPKLNSEVNTKNLLKGTTSGSHSVLLPLSSQAFEGTSAAYSVGSIIEPGSRGATSPIGVLCGGGPTAILTSQPQLINLTQLQAIMSAMANGASISIAAAASSTATTSMNGSSNATGTNTVSVLQSPNLSSVATTTASFSQLLSNTQSSQVPNNQVMLDTASLSVPPIAPLGSTQLPGHESASRMLLPTGLANVGAGLTTLAPSSVQSPSSAHSTNAALVTNSTKATTTLPGSESLSLASIISGSALTPQSCIANQALINLISSTSRSPGTSQNTVALSSVAAARLLNSLTGLTSASSAGLLPVVNAPTSICTPQGTVLSAAGGSMLSLLDSPQALLAAAAAAAAASASGNLNVNQIALANLRGSILSNTSNIGTQRTMGSNGPVIGLLDPRTGIQLRVADVSGVSASTTSHLLTPSDLVSCLSGGSGDASYQLTNTTNSARETERSTSGAGSEKRRKCAEIDLLRPNEAGTQSPYDNHLDDDWDSGQDDSSVVQANLQSIYSAGKKADPSIDSATSSPSCNGATTAFLSSPHRRSATGGPSRLSTLGGTSRARGIGSMSDSMQLGRPHRQNFTPTQNRILTEWYQTHQSKPYPSTDDTKELANISGLSYSQVKKWFANKRARSSSSGLPKPTPPMAPDSSPDPSAAAAIVAAAMAAATSAASGSDAPDCSDSGHPYLVNSQPLGALTPTSSRMEPDVTSCTDESESLRDDTMDHTHLPGTPELRLRITGDDHSCSSTDEEEPPLTVVNDPREEEIDPSPIRVSDLQMGTHIDQELEIKHRPHPVGMIDQAASPPTLQVFLAPRIVSPVSKNTSSDSLDDQIFPEDRLSPENITVNEHPSCAPNRVLDEADVLHESALTQKSKSLRSRGVILHAS